jgi:hypothetical protein
MSTPVLVRFPAALLAALDASIAAQSPPPTRPAAVRRLLEERLAFAPSDEVVELRRKFLLLARRVDEIAAHQG